MNYINTSFISILILLFCSCSSNNINDMGKNLPDQILKQQIIEKEINKKINSIWDFARKKKLITQELAKKYNPITGQYFLDKEIIDQYKIFEIMQELSEYYDIIKKPIKLKEKTKIEKEKSKQKIKKNVIKADKKLTIRILELFNLIEKYHKITNSIFYKAHGVNKEEKLSHINRPDNFFPK